MRRPLFGNGFPTLLPSIVPTPPFAGALKVFDTLDFTPQKGAPQAFAVTLYFWHWQNVVPVADPTKLPQPVAVATSGNNLSTALSLVPLCSYAASEIAALQAAQANDIARPIKLVDRFVVRGDQQIYAYDSHTVAGHLSGFVYGYYEVIGASVPTTPFRGLQPDNNLAAPFNYPPFFLLSTISNQTNNFKPLHLLNEDYIDLLDVNANVLWVSDNNSPPSAALLFSPTQGIILPAKVATTTAFSFRSKPFEYQPFTGGTVIQAGFGNTGNLGLGGVVDMSVYGNFLRR